MKIHASSQPGAVKRHSTSKSQLNVLISDCFLTAGRKAGAELKCLATQVALQEHMPAVRHQCPAQTFEERVSDSSFYCDNFWYVWP